MFGIDLGITVSSVTCINDKNEIIGDTILFGDRSNKDDWKRVVDMTDAIISAIDTISKSKEDIIINPYASIEEPVYPYRTRNPKSFGNLYCLYALLRYKLSKRNYEIYSVSPISVKATAKAMAFKNIRLKKKYAVRGRLTKDGMIRAFKKVMKTDPNYHTKQGRETLADSFFIARTGIDRRRVGLLADSRRKNKRG